MRKIFFLLTLFVCVTSYGETFTYCPSAQEIAVNINKLIKLNRKPEENQRLWKSKNGVTWEVEDASNGDDEEFSFRDSILFSLPGIDTGYKVTCLYYPKKFLHGNKNVLYASLTSEKYLLSIPKTGEWKNGDCNVEDPIGTEVIGDETSCPFSIENK